MVYEIVKRNHQTIQIENHRQVQNWKSFDL